MCHDHDTNCDRKRKYVFRRIFYFFGLLNWIISMIIFVIVYFRLLKKSMVSTFKGYRCEKLIKGRPIEWISDWFWSSRDNGTRRSHRLIKESHFRIKEVTRLENISLLELYFQKDWNVFYQFVKLFATSRWFCWYGKIWICIFW